MSGDAGFEGSSWRGWGKGFSQRDEAFSGRGKEAARGKVRERGQGST